MLLWKHSDGVYEHRFPQISSVFLLKVNREVGRTLHRRFHLYVSAFVQLFSFIKRTSWFPVDHVDGSVDFDWLHQSLWGYSGAGDSEVSLSLSATLWQKLLLNGRVASFSVGVPSGPTGRDNQTGQLQTDRQTDRCTELLLFLLNPARAHLGEF